MVRYLKHRALAANFHIHNVYMDGSVGTAVLGLIGIPGVLLMLGHVLKAESPAVGCYVLYFLSFFTAATCFGKHIRGEL